MGRYMDYGRPGKIRFSSKNKAVYFCGRNDDSSIKTGSDGNPIAHSAKKLGSGGTGKVYEVPTGPYPVPIVIKRYSNKILSESGSAIDPYLRSLIEFRKSLPDNSRRIVDQCTVWPQRLVFDDESGKVCGFAMHLIPPLFFSKMIVAGEEETKESNLDFLLHGSEFRRSHGLPALTSKGRARIIHDLMQIVLALHDHDYVLGDLSPKNMLVAVDMHNQGKNRVLLIDTDSFRKKGSIHPLKQLHTPDWIPPECIKAGDELKSLTPNANPAKRARLEIDMFMQNQCTDVYKMCLAITRLYHDREYAALITSSEFADKALRRDIGEDFADYVLSGLSEKPGDRPDAGTMLTCLKNSLMSKRRKAES